MRVNVAVAVRGDIERALGSLKRAMLKTGTLAEMKRRELGYVPPSERRRTKSAEARKKARKAMKKKADWEERNESRKPSYTPPTVGRSTDARDDRRSRDQAG